MIYSNPEFIILLTIVFLSYRLATSTKVRFSILLFSSLFFYAWAGTISFLIFISVIFYSWGMLWLAQFFSKSRAVFLTLGILGLVGNLFFWKYCPWFVTQVQQIFPTFLNGKEVELPLPIGISFFTLQGIAFLVDFYSGKAEYMSLKDFVLFKSFFPQLVAGPIVRVPQLLPQLQKLERPEVSDVSYGVSLFCLGFFKKIVLADRCAPFVNTVFADPGMYSRFTLVMAILGYAVQVWADFSGYTDMGRGAARILGIHLPENFLSPYLSKTPSEFWNRWHMTLGQWIRDYIYLPLALRVGRWVGAYGVTVLTMTVCGLWHGANWTFFFIGIYFGLQLVVEAVLRRTKINKLFKKYLPAYIQSSVLVLITLVSFLLAWVVFRAPNLHTAITFYRSLFFGTGTISTVSFMSNVYVGVFFCALIHVLFYYNIKTKKWLIQSLFEKPTLSLYTQKIIGNPITSIFCGISIGLIFACTVLLRFTELSKAFIYFQF